MSKEVIEALGWRASRRKTQAHEIPDARDHQFLPWIVDRPREEELDSISLEDIPLALAKGYLCLEGMEPGKINYQYFKDAIAPYLRKRLELGI